MTDEKRESRSLPVLLGMALSLLVLILVVNRSEAAANACGLCLRNAEWKAASQCGGKAGMIDPKTGQPTCYYLAYKSFEQSDCISTGICPGSGSFSGSKDCASEGCRSPESLPSGNCGKDADPGAGAICHNDCWGRSCSGGSGTCVDKYAYAPPNQVSVCYSQCGCSE